MGYLYENLSPEDFQKLCQSLLLHDYPDLQCFPIGQPDGGRDGYSRATGTVLQVKFKRKDEDVQVNADWVIDALKGELPKIERLMERGARRYVLAMNASGTGHLDVGSRDRVTAWVRENVPIEDTEVLWREDLDRRLERVPSLAMRYPTIATVADLIASGGSLSGSAQRFSAIRTFLNGQMDSDREVKFRQIELSADLADLFVDVPVGVSAAALSGGPDDEPTGIRAVLHGMLGDLEARVALQRGRRKGHVGDDRLHRLDVDAGRLILSPEAQVHARRIFLQGAPGQGKSTLAQRVCQVHRARWLAVMHEGHMPAEGETLRLPVKVDLRLLATFVRGELPFGDGPIPTTRSVEAFVSSLLHDGTGGLDFSVDDVHWMFRTLPVLLFLDGLDEIAEVDLRRRVVDTVVAFLGRARDWDLQVVVTSRPAVFGSLPDLEKHGFVNLRLLPLSQGHIDRFTEHWMGAQHLNSEERRTVTQVLRDRMSRPHIQELVRNPMQLTILLNLIGRDGRSLPEGRTDLYAQYTDLVIKREASKSTVVADRRELLELFLAELAWDLQLAAEGAGDSGTISLDDLRRKAAEFLDANNEPPELSEELFTGSERMYVLAAREPDRYEFEVQPMREYYCAWNLYKRAPSRTAWNPSPRGDRSERFVAIASNQFWLNVTRFYAGFLDRGELGAIPYGLKQIGRDGDAAAGLHARRVAQLLVLDRVFRNKPEIQEDVITFAFDDVGLLLAGQDSPDEVPVVPEDAGRNVVRDLLFAAVCNVPLSARPWHLCRLLSVNGGEGLTQRFLDLLDGAEGLDRTELLRRMVFSGAARDGAVDDIWELACADAPDVATLVRRSRLVAREYSEHVPSSDLLLDRALDGDPQWLTATPTTWHHLAMVSAAWLGSGYGFVSAPVHEFALGGLAVRPVSGDSRFGGALETFVRTLDGRAAGLVATGHSPRRAVLVATAQAFAAAFPGRWSTWAAKLQVLSALKAEPEMASALGGLLDGLAADVLTGDREADLVWWRSAYRAADSEASVREWVTLLLAHGIPDLLVALGGEIDEALERVTESDFDAMCRYFEQNAEKDGLGNVTDISLDTRGAALVSLVHHVEPHLIARRDALSRPPLSDWVDADRRAAMVVEGTDWGDAARVHEWLRIVMEQPVGRPGTNPPNVRQALASNVTPEVASAALSDLLGSGGEFEWELAQIVLSSPTAEPVQAIVERDHWEFE